MSSTIEPVNNKKTFSELYDDLQPAHIQKLIRVFPGHEIPHGKPFASLGLVFPVGTPDTVQQKLAAHIQKHYSVKVFHRKDTLTVVKLGIMTGALFDEPKEY